jgi:hypothetical protein
MFPERLLPNECTSAPLSAQQSRAKVAQPASHHTDRITRIRNLRVADDSIRQLYFGDDIGECDATAGLQHASAYDQKTQPPCNGTSFKARKGNLWAVINPEFSAY